MAEDPRTVLDDAARRRLACQILPRGGTWKEAWLVRVDRAGVVVVTDSPEFSGGEDVRVWFAMDDKPHTFEASVLRAGVPVPDRSQHGLMLGFIDSWSTGPQEDDDDALHAEVTVLPSKGRGLQLLGGDCRIVDLSARELAFTVPRKVALKFVEGGRVRVRVRLEGERDYLVAGLVKRLAPGEGHYLYGLHFEEIEDEARHLHAVEQIRSRL